MDFFDKLTKKAAETYKGAAEKTGKLAKEAKLKIQINDNKTKINNLYKEIGKKVYEKHISDEDICIKSEIEDECKKIDELSNEIEEYHKIILELSDSKICENCKETIEKNVKFCPKCGAEQPEIIEEPAREVEVIEEVIEKDEVKEDSKTKSENNNENNEETTQNN